MPITTATIKDVRELNCLVNSAYRGEDSKKGWTTEANLLDGLRIDEETLITYLEDPKITILKNVDEEDGRITGCVYLELRKPKLYIGMFSVSPLIQNKGIGRQLLLAAEAFALQSQCNTLTMTVISTRHELTGWYERRGYAATGEIIPFNHGTRFGIPNQPIELIVMEKTV